MLRVISLVSAGLIVMATSASASSDRWTWIDSGNDARIVDTVGFPGKKVCVQAIDAETGEPATVRLWRDADPGRKKDLDMMNGTRTLETRGIRYSVFVHNTTGRPIYAARCGACPTKAALGKI